MTANQTDPSLSSASSCRDGENPAVPAPLAWLMSLLQEAMTGVMGGEATPLQKANAVARLGGLYLKAYQFGELEQANKKLVKQMAELEQRLADMEASSTDRGESQENDREISLILSGEPQPSEGVRAAPEGSRSAVPLLVSGTALLPRAAAPLGNPQPGPP